MWNKFFHNNSEISLFDNESDPQTSTIKRSFIQRFVNLETFSIIKRERK